MVSHGLMFKMQEGSYCKVSEIFAQGFNYHELNDVGDCIGSEAYLSREEFSSGLCRGLIKISCDEAMKLFAQNPIFKQAVDISICTVIYYTYLRQYRRLTHCQMDEARHHLNRIRGLLVKGCPAFSRPVTLKKASRFLIEGEFYDDGPTYKKHLKVLGSATIALSDIMEGDLHEWYAYIGVALRDGIPVGNLINSNVCERLRNSLKLL